MRYVSIIEQATDEARRTLAEKADLAKHVPEGYQHPQEDYLAVSDSPSVFVVADGVTLGIKKLMENSVSYPDPSPAGEVAKIFCEAVVKSAQLKYDEFDEKKITEVFKEANREVEKYNQKIGKSDFSGNITGLYAATGAFVLIKYHTAYWASICDSFVAHFDKEMELKFMSSGSCVPYAVINGEEKMAGYLEDGVFDLKTGDRVFVLTDGFEHYAKNADFLKLFKNWPEDLKKRIAKFSKEMNSKDPKKYGKERSLIAILV